MVNLVASPEKSNIENLIFVLNAVLSTMTTEQRRQAEAILSEKVREKMNNGKDSLDGRCISDYSAKLGLKLSV